jgi:hypothetical protein
MHQMQLFAELEPEPSPIGDAMRAMLDTKTRAYIDGVERPATPLAEWWVGRKIRRVLTVFRMAECSRGYQDSK